MLQNTFCHIPNITSNDEQILWDNGITSWKDFSIKNSSSLSDYKLNSIVEYLDLSKDNLQYYNPKFFTELLKPNNHWKLFPEFRESIAYIDIETTGLGEYANITTIALYDGKEIYTYVRGRNLDDFKKDIENYKIIVTYNGKSFDVPFIRRELGVEMNHIHLDLRYILFNLGYKGGLKGCEKQLGIGRNGLEDIDGYFAVLLWQEFKRTNNEEALNTLLAYNIEDVINLETLMVIAYNLNLEKTPFVDQLEILNPTRPIVTYKPNKNVIDKIRFRYR